MPTLYPKISVITICLNAANCIRKTLNSVIGQTYPNIEYIVVDGISIDGTIEIIEQHAAHISKFSSEKDSGIYDAMNRALDQCSGDFVCFMNAGDTFSSHETLLELWPALDKADLIYGDTYLIDESESVVGLRSEKTPHKLPDKLQLKSFMHGLPFCHQSLITRRSICSPYNLKYKVSADIDWIIRVYKAAHYCHKTDNPIARYQIDGFAQRNWIKGLKERFSILVSHFGFPAVVKSHCRILTKRLRHILSGGTLK